MGLSVQCIMDLVVAGISLVIGLGFFAFIASILCSAVFIYNVKHVSWFVSPPSNGTITPTPTPTSLFIH